jgi:hypothetical protein
MSAKQIIEQIDSLPSGEQSEVYNYLSEKMRRREHIVKTLERMKGVGKGLWEKDAQEYITEMRSNDRF